MATYQVSFDVQNTWGGTAPGNRTFTGHVFLFAHGHCVLQWDHTRECATDILAHNTCGTRACSATTETARFGLTTHPCVRCHLSLLQVCCDMIVHPCQSNGHSTKQTKKFVASAGRMLVCATPVYGSARNRGQFGTFAVFTKADRVPTAMSQRPPASIWASKKTMYPS